MMGESLFCQCRRRLRCCGVKYLQKFFQRFGLPIVGDKNDLARNWNSVFEIELLALVISRELSRHVDADIIASTVYL